jgi:hypothetical protein
MFEGVREAGPIITQTARKALDYRFFRFPSGTAPEKPERSALPVDYP